MSIIVKQDTNGTKPLLQVGELGYDNFPVGGDEGRVYVGTGTSNIAQAKKSEVMAVDSKVDTHVARDDNPHGVTKAQVGLGNVDNTSDADKPISTATQSALYLKANVDNAVLTGIPTAPTAAVGTDTTQLATTAFVKAEVASEIASVNLLRADKYLASQNVVNMEYNVEGKLAKVQYNNAIDENYEVLSYNVDGKLSNVAHYVDTILKGNTELSYSGGKLIAAPYVAV